MSPQTLPSKRAPLPDSEAAVCLRLKEAREKLGLSQEEVAKRVGLKGDTLSMLERCKAPVRYDVGLRICRELVISEEWLATGGFAALEASAEAKGLGKRSSESLGPIYFRHCLDLWSEPITLSVAPRALLTCAFDETLRERNAELAMQHYYEPRLVPTDLDGLEIRFTVLRAMFDRSLLMLENEALRLGQSKEVARLTQYTFLRTVLETSDVLFRRFIGLPTPHVRESRFDFLRALVNFEDQPIGPLSTVIEREKVKRQKPRSRKPKPIENPALN